MIQYKSLNVKLFNSQLNKLKSGIKHGTKVTLNFLWNVMDDSNAKANVPYKLLLADRQVLKPCKVFANNSQANIKLLIFIWLK